MSDTDAWDRVLRYIADRGPAVSLLELKHVRLLERDDHLVVGTLIYEGLVERVFGLVAVQLTPAGRAYVGVEIRP